MTIDFEIDFELMLLLPLAAVGFGACDNPECETDHFRVSIGWLFFSLHFIF